MEHRERKPQLGILFFLYSFTNLLALFYTAALPNLKEAFHITKNQAQLTIALFLLGYSIGLLVYGPLSNALGRKKAIYIGGGISILGSIICLISSEMLSFPLLLVGRFLTAFGACCGLSLTYVIIADAYSHAEAKKKISYIVGGFAVFPAVGIALGGLMTDYLSWKSCFYFMLVYSVFVIVLCSFLPETLKEKQAHHLKIKTIIKAYCKQGCHLGFLLCVLILMSGGFFMYIFAAEAPFIAKELNLSPTAFGLYDFIPYIGLFLGGFASALLSHRLSSKNLLLLGCGAAFLFSAAMLALFIAGKVNIFSLFVVSACVFFTISTIISHSTAIALVVSEDRAYAASLMNALQEFLIFLSISSLSFMSAPKNLMLPLFFTGCSFMILLVCFILRGLKLKPV